MRQVDPTGRAAEVDLSVLCNRAIELRLAAVCCGRRPNQRGEIAL
jgi:hypothetical protein